MMRFGTLSDIGRWKSFRLSDNGRHEVLCKVLSFPSDFRLTSTFVYKTVPLGVGSRPEVRKKPLRLIVARTPVTFEYKPGSDYFLTYFLDTANAWFFGADALSVLPLPQLVAQVAIYAVLLWLAWRRLARRI